MGSAGLSDEAGPGALADGAAKNRRMPCCFALVLEEAIEETAAECAEMCGGCGEEAEEDGSRVSGGELAGSGGFPPVAFGLPGVAPGTSLLASDMYPKNSSLSGGKDSARARTFARTLCED